MNTYVNTYVNQLVNTTKRSGNQTIIAKWFTVFTENTIKHKIKNKK